ncbi:hypothetical protein N7466_006096 [Penicillium verhagenii]|uniref:uncharacterized protein n=1 Tax=Penicillium verhagenii TaxID=1562060 RepID=UPI00254559BB|nr:uncharacterized protein N7466_006096 [Penicillium verhagenii]KAJ5930603.1 hypothetical protein N7466_006096 [Penicillium verhagenii]
MSNDAQIRALAIPEIVTSILHELDMRTLLAAQRINSVWRNLICNSKSLQETLFFRPIRHEAHDNTRVKNPLLAESFPSLFPTHVLGDGNGQNIKLIDLPWEKNSAFREIFLRPEASWRRMLTHQPPIYKVGGYEYSFSPFLWGWSQAMADFSDDGLRMSSLFEYVVDRSPDIWVFETLSIFYPSTFPPGFVESLRHVRRWKEPQVEMMGQFDIVFFTFCGMSCTSEEDYEEAREEMEREAREKGIELPDTDTSVAERIWEYYRKTGAKMRGLEMKKYCEEEGAWD